MTKKKDPKDLKPEGRKSDYRTEYCEMLIKHMKEGGSFKSFGSIVSKSETTLNNWLDANPEFLVSKKLGEVHSLYFYENMGKMLATGQIKTLVEESVAMAPNKKGKQEVVRDKDGNPIMNRKYQQAHASTGAWAFMMKNMHHWRDQRNVAVSGDGQGAPIAIRRAEELTPDERLREIKEMHQFLIEMGDDAVIDVTPKK